MHVRKREWGETENKEERCVCARLCGNLISGWTVHTAPAYTVLKTTPQGPQRSSVRVFGEFSSPTGSRARLASLSLRTEDQEAPQGPAPLIRA